MTIGETQEGPTSELRMVKSTPSTTQQALKRKEDMKIIEREITPARRGKVEEETAAPKKTVTVTGLQKIEEIGVENIAKKVIKTRGGMLAMGNENTAQRPLVMGGL